MSAALRRVLRRARDGVILNTDEAAVAMTARGDDLADLCASAARIRDAGLLSAGRRGPGGARQAAAAGAPLTTTAPIWFFSYQRPRHRPASSSW